MAKLPDPVIPALPFAMAPVVHAQDADALAKQLSNPIASLTSVPMQRNYDDGIGPLDDGDKTGT